MQHHAYFYEGPFALLSELASHAREQFGFTDTHSPDVHVLSWEKFGIDESRELTDTATLKSSGGRALFVVGLSSITTQAQQALLKLFEEPQEGLTFVLLLPHGTLLPTLRSRMMRYPGEVEGEKAASVKKFLDAPYKSRSEEITKLLKDDDGAKERAREFVNALEAEMFARVQKTKDKKELLQALEDVRMVRDYLGDRSASLKMLLEHLAVALPR
jgi:hypothetical protein